MKTRSIGFAFSLVGLLLLCNACRRGNMMVVNNGDYKLTVRYDGEIEISDDETDFESISPRGYIKYNKNGSHMYAEGNNHGDVSYELSLNGHDVDSTPRCPCRRQAVTTFSRRSPGSRAA